MSSAWSNPKKKVETGSKGVEGQDREIDKGPTILSYIARI